MVKTSLRGIERKRSQALQPSGTSWKFRKASSLVVFQKIFYETRAIGGFAPSKTHHRGCPSRYGSRGALGRCPSRIYPQARFKHRSFPVMHPGNQWQLHSHVSTQLPPLCTTLTRLPRIRPHGHSHRASKQLRRKEGRCNPNVATRIMNLWCCCFIFVLV